MVQFGQHYNCQGNRVGKASDYTTLDPGFEPRVPFFLSLGSFHSLFAKLQLVRLSKTPFLLYYPVALVTSPYGETCPHVPVLLWKTVVSTPSAEMTGYMTPASLDLACLKSTFGLHFPEPHFKP